MTDAQVLRGVKDYISGKGFSYEDGLIENFYLSLKARPFVLLAGSSGTDMTRLPALFAEALGATAENGRYKQLTVQPDWMDSSDMFGYLDLNGSFVPGAIIDFLKAAQQDPDRPYFLCLDRLILSRAEYYLNEILSAVESRAQPEGAKPLVTGAYYGRDTAAAERYGVIPALDNLYIVGTVNMDETSRPLNQRFLDRMHTMQLSRDALTADRTGCSPQPVEVPNGFLRTRYFRLEQCQEEKEVLQAYFKIFGELDRILNKASAYMGFRLRNDAILYLMHNRQSAVLEERDALDHEISMKVLTRVQGSSKAIKPVLCELFRYCAADAGAFRAEQENISTRMLAAAQSPDCRYRRSAARIARMMRLCEEDGFASFWD